MEKRRKILKLNLRSSPSFNGHQMMRKTSPYSESVKSIRRYRQRRSGLFAHKSLQSDANFSDILKGMSPVKKVGCCINAFHCTKSEVFHKGFLQ